jgi:phosphate transport system substrate-binding protein
MIRTLLAGCLAAGLAMASAQAQPVSLQRERLHIVSSGSAHAVTESLSAHFAERYGSGREPRVEILGSIAALERFCAGMGPNTPDLAVSSRRIPRNMADACRANGVTDVVELQLGLGAVVIAVRRGDPLAAITTPQIYAALAAEMPTGEDEFRPNSARRWRDIQPDMPDLPIAAVLPSRGSATRGLFNDFAMEGGCRENPAIRRIYSAAFRVAKCVTLRRDGAVREVDSAEVPGALLVAPFGTIAPVSYAQLFESGGNLVPLPLNGVLPNAHTIGNRDYPITRTIFLYAKRQHARAVGGVGVVLGIQEFLVDAVSEPVAGPGGLLADFAGVVPLPPADRLAQQQAAARMRLMNR